MKKFVKFVVSIFLAVGIQSGVLKSQEVVVGLQTNPVLQNLNIKKNTTVGDTINLPFWDDFSDSAPFPKTTFWQDNFAFINSTYANNPPSLGFATMDLVDSQGNFYADAGFNKTFAADRLTSQPINLETGSNIFISFYFRPQGNADAPEPTDSLTLEFYSPQTKKWASVWQTPGTFDHSFQFVSIPVNNPLYLQKGFQFRFTNYGSFGSQVFPSLAANADQWNIDFVYLNKNRFASDSVFHDVALTSLMHSFLKDYESMPWQHFLTQPNKFINPTLTLGIKNNDNIIRLLNRLTVSVQETIGSGTVLTIETGSQNLPKYKEIAIEKDILINFPDNALDSARFLIQSQFFTDSYDSVQNNLTHYEQVFKNYYAYDDGTAEAGYGLMGTGTKYGKAAYKFYPEKPDGVIGVEIYFNKTFNDASNKYFFLDLWKQENGFPVDTAYFSLNSVRPEYENQLNQFHYYAFNDTVFVADTFYVGWQQTTEDLLNVGIDLNRNASQNLYYNIGNGWKPSQVEGAVMIRPVFCGHYIAPPAKKDMNIPVKLYPTPAKTFLTIDIPAEFMSQIINLKIYDISGRLIFADNQFMGKPIDVADYRPGIYILKIISDENYSTLLKFSVIK
jgi:hypothetical protein